MHKKREGLGSLVYLYHVEFMNVGVIRNLVPSLPPPTGSECAKMCIYRHLLQISRRTTGLLDKYIVYNMEFVPLA